MSSGSQDDPVEVSDDDIEALGIQDEDYGDGDTQLGQDEDEAIKKSNILRRGDILRHAQPRSANAYNEGPGEDDLPEEAE